MAISIFSVLTTNNRYVYTDKQPYIENTPSPVNFLTKKCKINNKINNLATYKQNINDINVR